MKIGFLIIIWNSSLVGLSCICAHLYIHVIKHFFEKVISLLYYLFFSKKT